MIMKKREQDGLLTAADWKKELYGDQKSSRESKGALCRDGKSDDEWLDKDETVQLPKPVEGALYIDKEYSGTSL